MPAPTPPSDPAGDQLRADAPAAGVVEAAEAAARTIAGIVLPWHDQGNTSAGGLRFTPRSIRLPRDLSRVKLLRDHTGDPNGGVPVGVATAFENRPEGLFMRFSIANTAEGDRALVEAAEHVRDSFSIEAAQLTRTGPDVTDSVLKAVALVPYPAFAAAQVETVTASDHEPPAADGATGTDAAGPGAGTDPAPPTVPADAGTDPAATGTDATAGDQLDTTTEENTDMPQATTDLRPAVVPAGLPGAPTAPAIVTASEVVETIVAMRAGRQVDEAHAALADITNSGHIDVAPPAWLGELWSGVTYQRRIVPLLTQKPLTSWKAKGYRWGTKPKVAKYAGDKADIPTNTPTTVPVEVEAERWAGGHDIDRKFLDFNDAEFLAAYWAAMAESYAEETDADTAAFLATNATAIPEAAPDLIRAVTRAAIRIDQKIRSAATFAIINPEDLETILDIAELDAPKYMGLTPISDPSKWTTSEFVEKGTAIVGAQAAATFYELSGSPIRVQAEHVAKGGQDAALFGYTAALLNRPEGLLKVTFGSVIP
ncbi:major capsid and protease fusion protein [Gordonia phage Schiebs]|nr:major capsid and protease fusion protein [Gordonia phage Schiebs]